MKIKMDSDDSPASISPLPPVLSQGLAAVSIFGFLSFLSSLALWGYLTYKLLVWHTRPRPAATPTSETPPPTPEPDSPTGLSDVNGFLVPHAHLCPPKEPDAWELQQKRRAEEEALTTLWERVVSDPPNQFLVLVYNLLFADIQQALAFLLNAAWLSRDAIQAGSAACWAQGWFLSTGDLASGAFVTAIAVHTYLGVVRGYRPPTWGFYAAIGALWAFVFGVAVLGVAITENGRDTEGFYVRAGAWCWINSAYQNLRLTLHYLWIFFSLAVTLALYVVIFFHIHVHRKHSPTCCLAPGADGTPAEHHYPNPDPNHLAPPSSSVSLPLSPLPSQLPSQPPSPMPSPSFAPANDSAGDDSHEKPPPQPSPTPTASARHPTFLLYPLIYLLCTVPLAGGRIASMAGRDVSLGYFCFAGSMIASAGWMDVLLYSTTRRSIVFSGRAPPSQDTGLETFEFMRTPPGRRFGNVVFVSGGGGQPCVAGGGSSRRSVRRSRWESWNGEVMASARLATLKGGGGVPGGGASKEALGIRGFGMGGGEVMGMAIQCETTTKVVVEEVPPKEVGGSPTSSGGSSGRSSRGS